MVRAGATSSWILSRVMRSKRASAADVESDDSAPTLAEKARDCPRTTVVGAAVLLKHGLLPALDRVAEAIQGV